MTKVIQDKAQIFEGTNRSTLDTKNPTGGETIPDAPSGSVSTGISSSVIRTTWVDNSDNETGFEVHGSDTENGTYILLDTVGAGIITYDETGLSASQTRWHKERATNTAGDSAFSNKDSATTATAASAPGKPTQFLPTDNEDGTGSFTWLLADDTNTGSKIQIWKNDTTEWVTLLDLDSTPTVELANNVTIPGSTGATVNGSDEFGLRLRVDNETGFDVSSGYWTQITDIGGSSLTAGTLILTIVDTTTINIKYGVEPTNQSADPNGVQLQRVLTVDEVGPENWADVAGIDTVTELTGAGSNNTVTTETQYSYRAETTDGVDIIYTPIARGTASTVAEADLLFDGFETGDMTAPNGPSPALNVAGFSWSSLNATSLVEQKADPVGNTQIWPDYIEVGDSRDWTAKDGNNSLRFRYPVGADTSEQRFTLTAQPDLWTRYWIRVPTNYSHGVIGGSNNKFLALWAGVYDQSGDITLQLRPSANGSSLVIQDGGVAVGEVTVTSDFIDTTRDRGRWMQFVIRAVEGSSLNADDGIIQIWRRWEDEQAFTQLLDKQDAGFYQTGDGIEAGYLMGWANGQYAVDTEFLVDNFELSTGSLV